MTDEQRKTYQTVYAQLETLIEASSDPERIKKLQEQQKKYADAIQSDNAATESVVSQS